MKVLMFGWEFPPFSSGGLGTACYGLTKSLSGKGVQITFVLPYSAEPCPAEISDAGFIRILQAGKLRIKKIKSILQPYMTPQEYKNSILRKAKPKMYGSTLFEEVHNYTVAAEKIAEEEQFDVIHCHDWMTFGAGLSAKRKRNKPLVLHVHATELDRTGGHQVNQYVYDLEREGMHKADKVIAVSNFTKGKIMSNYGVPEEKISVVHNAVNAADFSRHYGDEDIKIKKSDKEKLVLFLGRITLQKGPDYFVYAAKKVLEHEQDVKFIIAGSGDMEPFIVEKAAELGIAGNVLFAGFLSQEDVERAYKMADVYVMPSVSEPFGITALEAMKNKTPAIVSNQSGVSEVVRHCLKVDFWDIDELSSKIISVLRYKALREALRENAYSEVRRFNWDIPAEKCIEIYNKIIK